MGRNRKGKKHTPIEPKIPEGFLMPKPEPKKPEKSFITREVETEKTTVVTRETQEHGGRDNYDFVQLSRGYLKAWRELSIKQPLAAGILMYLVEHMGRTTNAVICSYKTLQEVTGYSRPSIARAIKVLKEDNWVEAVKVGSATAYCVNERVAWQAGKNQRKYAMFSATVVASQNEQDSTYLEKAKQELKYIPVVRTGEQAIVSNEDLPPPDQRDLT